MNELRVACEIWSTEVCEVSLTKNLRGKPAIIRLGKVEENLEKVSKLVLPWNEQLHSVGAQVIMEFVHMHEGLEWFPAVARLIESGPSHVELQGGSTIAVACGWLFAFQRNGPRWKVVSRAGSFAEDGTTCAGRDPTDAENTSMSSLQRLLSCSWNAGEPRIESWQVIHLAIRGSHCRDEFRMGWSAIRCHRRPRWHPVVGIYQ